MNSGYSAADRLVHRLALAHLGLQKSLADMESHLHASLLKQVPAERPVFVTSLPRAGTTLLLQILHETGAFASQTYRDMPFVLCPLLWHSLSRGLRRTTEARERAHGDGVIVGYDSPEAFEEVLWKAFWPQKYTQDRILTWSRHDRDAEFEQAFADHMRKVIAVREGERAGARRYLAKNNANIARLPLLAQLFPDCTILIPFRNPADHAGSLARQHANFLRRHAQDRFAQRYMEWLGHYEFGKAFRPIAFADGDGSDPTQPGYWLDYWDRAFRHILRHAPDQAVFVDYDRLCEGPEEGLQRIAEALGLRRETLAGQAGRFRPSNHYEPAADSRLWRHAQQTYAMLQSRDIGAAVDPKKASAS
jgi:Sulfotransferase family